LSFSGSAWFTTSHLIIGCMKSNDRYTPSILSYILYNYPLGRVTNAASCVVLCYNLYNHPLGRVDNVTARFTPADGPLVMHSLAGLSYNSTPLGRWLTITVLGHTYSPYNCPLGRDLCRMKYRTEHRMISTGSTLYATYTLRCASHNSKCNLIGLY